MAIPYTTTASLPYGSRVITIGGLAYVAQNFSTDQSLNVIERTDELGAPNGAVGIQTARTGSAQLQLATSAITVPSAGDEFSAKSITWFLTQVGEPEEASSFKVVDVSFRESV